MASMSPNLRLVFVLHNHQPIGNFDGVFQSAYEDSYRAFLDVFEDYPNLPIALHTSGSLMEWLAARHPEYLDRLAALVSAGRLEIVGGAFYEPILAMIPPRDRVGQIRRYSEWLSDRFTTAINGMWIPERVWEQSFTGDLVDAGVRYTVLDDFHFKNAGLAEDNLHGYYITEDNGKLLSVFPGSERLRYTIPFREPEETMAYLRPIAERQPGAVVVFGDDGEKFGVWPGTKEYVYTNGWLRRFFDALVQNRSWLSVVSPTEALEQVPPLGKIYIPEGSYREMTEWALPTERLKEFIQLKHRWEHEGRWQEIAPFVRGGYWRNFKVKYPETDEMYARMQMVSRRLQEMTSAHANCEASNGNGNRRTEPRAQGHVRDESLIGQARAELYRGQCNCGYWHGAFGGAYLPHLRNAIYQHLISADNLLDASRHRSLAEGDLAWVELTTDDYNLDARPEVRLASNRLMALVAPSYGGHLYELDVRSICHNLLATLARREEAYHIAVRAGEAGAVQDVASIHDRVIFKQKDLDKRLQFDRYPRKSLIDHFYSLDVSAAAVEAGNYQELGDFVTGAYEARLRRSPKRMQLQLTRKGHVGERIIQITKGLTLEAGSQTLQVAYVLEGLPPGALLHFGIEFNFAGLPSGCDDRYFHDALHNQLGQLGSRFDLENVDALGLSDEWLGIDVEIQSDQPMHVWTFPIETVSQSEGGFELVHQSVVVHPHWYIKAGSDGRWIANMTLAIDTAMAEKRPTIAEVIATA
ncbi:MAG TPA: alpha-amylase/4-alpha-glucanotransferase domain-containing protein [Lacipirellulaceae bacterium]|nr:alpha-amylase/4-alpha-glucanotransferase domain-containing protein [Lacipirellulaceae bacterium]